jgi:hypothetical protein
MLNAKLSFSSLLMAGLSAAALATVSASVHGQDVPAVHVGYSAITGVPQDWSHHHVVFSNPGTEQEAIKAGRYDEWLHVVNDPRYVMQQMRRGAAAQGPSSEDVDARRSFSAQFAPVNGRDSGFGPKAPVDRFTKPSFQAAPLKKDWNTNLTASSIMGNTFPAKYSFSTTGTPSCPNDFVLYPTGATGSATAATVVAYNNIYPGTAPPGCGSATAPETVYWAFNTGAAAVTTSPVFSGDGSEVAFIQSNGTAASLVLVKWNAGPAAATPTGVLAATSPEVTLSTAILTAADVGAQISAATGIPAGDTISQVLSSTTANLTTAPTAHAAQTLTIHAEAVATPGVPPTVTAANFSTCTAPCMFTAALSGGQNDTYSSPFYDYPTDTLYVGDNGSKLHKFTGVFRGTPTEATPVTLNATSFTVASPVYDSASGCVFAGDSQGHLYSVNSGNGGSGTCNSGTFSLNATSETLGNGAANEGIFDGVLLDSSAGTIYAFVADSALITHAVTASVTTGSAAFNVSAGTVSSADVGRTVTGTADLQAATTIATVTSATTGTLSKTATGNDATDTLTITEVTAGSEAVDQFPTSFGATAAPASAQPLGTGGAGYNLYSGSFDQTYYSSGTPSTPSGNIWVVGNQGTAGTNNLYRVPIASNVMNASVSAVTLNSTRHGWAPPVTEFFNTSTTVDSIYFAINHASVGGNCTAATGNGCILAYNVTTTTPALEGSTNFVYPGTNGCWGTSAFTIDNGTSSTDTSNVYFMWFGGNSSSTATATCTAATGNTSEAISESQGATF